MMHKSIFILKRINNLYNSRFRIGGFVWSAAVTYTDSARIKQFLKWTFSSFVVVVIVVVKNEKKISNFVLNYHRHVIQLLVINTLMSSLNDTYIKNLLFQKSVFLPMWWKMLLSLQKWFNIPIMYKSFKFHICWFKTILTDYIYTEFSSTLQF